MSDRAAAGAAAALVGGLAALAGSVLLPFHGGGGMGTWIAGLFLVAGLALALASIDLAWSDGAGLRTWAALGAAGFVVGGAGLVGDVIEQPIAGAEIAGVVVVAAWWLAVGRALRSGRVSSLGTFSLLLAALSLGALALQLTWNAPAGAVPVRFAYVLWAPWGLWLAAALLRHPRPFRAT